jgi:hypothetical protein
MSDEQRSLSNMREDEIRDKSYEMTEEQRSEIQ